MKATLHDSFFHQLQKIENPQALPFNIPKEIWERDKCMQGVKPPVKEFDK